MKTMRRIVHPEEKSALVIGWVPQVVNPSSYLRPLGPCSLTSLGFKCFAKRDGFQPNSDGLQPKSDGLQPTSDGLQPNSDGLLYT